MATSTRFAGNQTESAILARLIQTRREPLSIEAANYLLSLRFDESDVSRMNELSELARLGALGAEQEAELDSYIHVSNLLAVMQSKARLALQQLPATR